MKVLYGAYRHDPRNPMGGSGADYQFYSAFVSHGFDVSIVGPFQSPSNRVESILARIYKRITDKRYAKFSLSASWYASRKLNQAVMLTNPDAVFTMFPPLMTYYNQSVPCLYRVDTTFAGWQSQYTEFGHLAFQILLWQEKRAYSNTSHIITHSEWNKNSLIEDYQINENHITVLPNPAALPQERIPKSIDVYITKKLENKLRLLFVGRIAHRKGLDIAIQVVKELNKRSIDATLNVVGMDGQDTEQIHFAGLLKKNQEDQLLSYLNYYSLSHMLLHPARFDPSPIVTSEAAAFATPVITNASGGIATSVTEESGIVLPMGSPPEAYVDAIIGLFSDPQRYYALCESARARYERELNWDVAGRRVAAILEEVVAEHKK